MTLTANAPAKINLFLDITGKRADGYHTIESIFQTVSIYDIITINKNSSSKTNLTVTNPDIPDGRENIAFKAYEMFINFTGINFGADIHIEKNIPAGAGLGGGSSDAAAVLKLLNCMFNTKLTDAQLHSIALKLGADVPFFLYGGAALIKGVGEQITPLPPLPKMDFLIAMGKTGISTADAYKKTDLIPDIKHGDISKMLEAVKLDPKNIHNYLFNIFEEATDLKDVFNIKSIMLKSNASAALMTGSGSAVFGIFKNETNMSICENELKGLCPHVFRCCNCG